MELAAFKKTVKMDQKTNSDSDMIKCSSCEKSMGIKKWARLATEEEFICPGCGAKAKPGATVKIALKEPSRFKVESIKTGKASVEVREDGSRLIKETVHVRVKPKTTQA